MADTKISEAAKSFSDGLPVTTEGMLQILLRLPENYMPWLASVRKNLRVEVDASLDGLGAVLSQYQDGQGHVIAYASRTLRSNEKTMCQYSSMKL